MEFNPPIGGFIGEEPDAEGGNKPEGLSLSTGRACLSLLLRIVVPKRLYLPYYTCDALLEPVKEGNWDFEFYSIDSALEPRVIPILEPNELFLYINYFGVKGNYIEQLQNKLGEQLLIDCSQAFYAMPGSKVWCFNSARKFFGLPDGAFLQGPGNPTLNDVSSYKPATGYLAQRAQGQNEKAYLGFQENEAALGGELRASAYTQQKISKIDYQGTASRRRKNFSMLHRALADLNSFRVELTETDVPLCYPFLPKKKLDVTVFHRAGAFVPVYWKDVIDRGIPGFAFEEEFSRRLLPLPIDQRYSEQEINKLITFVLSQIEHGE